MSLLLLLMHNLRMHLFFSNFLPVALSCHSDSKKNWKKNHFFFFFRTVLWAMKLLHNNAVKIYLIVFNLVLSQKLALAKLVLKETLLVLKCWLATYDLQHLGLKGWIVSQRNVYLTSWQQMNETFVMVHDLICCKQTKTKVNK